LAQYFFDTSALVKYYHVEAGTPAVSEIFAEPDRKIRISTLGLLETQSAFAMKVRSGALTRDGAGLQRARLMLDIAAGDIEVYSVAEEHFVAAERLVGATDSRDACEPSTPCSWRRRSICNGRVS
jgi:hypothetical protein